MIYLLNVMEQATPMEAFLLLCVFMLVVFIAAVWVYGYLLGRASRRISKELLRDNKSWYKEQRIDMPGGFLDYRRHDDNKPDVKL